MNFIIILLNFYMWILLARVAISWLRLDYRNPLVNAIYSVTEPVLAPIRRVIPVTGGFDLSPVVVFFAIYILKNLFR